MRTLRLHGRPGVLPPGWPARGLGRGGPSVLCVPDTGHCLREGPSGLVTQLCQTLCNPVDRDPPASSVCEILRNSAVGCCSLLQWGWGLPDPGIKAGCPALQADMLCCLNHQGSPSPGDVGPFNQITQMQGKKTGFAKLLGTLACPKPPSAPICPQYLEAAPPGLGWREPRWAGSLPLGCGGQATSTGGCRCLTGEGTAPRSTWEGLCRRKPAETGRNFQAEKAAEDR